MILLCILLIMWAFALFTVGDFYRVLALLGVIAAVWLITIGIMRCRERP